MPKISRWSFYLLAFLLPLHNLIVQSATKIFGWSEYIVLYKDLILLVAFTPLAIEIFKYLRQSKKNLTETQQKLYKFGVLTPLVLILLINIWGLLTSIINFSSFGAVAFGYYFEVLWLNFFALAVSYTSLQKILNSTFNKEFFSGLNNFFIASFLIVSAVSVASLIIGQETVLKTFGYGLESSTSEFVSTTIPCHKIDFGEETCRLTGTLSHPIHFSAYLLLSLVIFTKNFLESSDFKFKLAYALMIASCFVFGYLSYSRYAIMSLGVLAVIFLSYYLSTRFGSKIVFRLSKALIFSVLFIQLFIGLVFINIDPSITTKFLPTFISKPSSSNEHLRHVQASLDIIKDSTPVKLLTGYGLGATGSASREKYQELTQNSVERQLNTARTISFKYFSKRPARYLLIENWYIQTFLNAGLIYALLYIWITIYPIKYIWSFFKSADFNQKNFQDLVFSSIFLSLIIGNQFLLLWENQTVAGLWIIVYMWYISSKITNSASVSIQ